jgi:hypothetical protein
MPKYKVGDYITHIDGTGLWKVLEVHGNEMYDLFCYSNNRGEPINKVCFNPISIFAMKNFVLYKSALVHKVERCLKLK